MMATEPPKDRSNEATVTSKPESVTKIDSNSQDVASDKPQVISDNGNTELDEVGNKYISDIVDDLVNSAEVSVSGGSDSEAARSKLRDDEKGHGRASAAAVKKPTSFKSVSVNKTFLASKGVAATATSKSGDKPSPGLAASQSTAGAATTSRPRLIAKTGSGGLVAKSSSGINGGKSSPAPDGNAVWNKNRPAPTPEPKRMTDEELKKYGIHMANRLNPDDGKGQANWADIDDDDDDWAPETITWKDGTKITVPHVEEHATTQVAAQPTQKPLPKDLRGLDKPKSPASNASPSVKPSGFTSGKGLVLKGAPEKPTLVAKPPAPPAPAKSPWAAIPKVENATLVVPEPSPTHSGGVRHVARDGFAPRSVTPPPPKEIAADDFNRSSWRDGHAPGNRELYNSQNGRYEPVTDRRTSMRGDQHARQPAVLQRTSQADNQGPAEPSAAFQTSRVSEPHGTYGRRRGSSNVSGGSGTFFRQKGFEQPIHPPELLNARRESFTAGSDSGASARNFSPAGQHHIPQHPNSNQGWPPHMSPATVHASPHQPAAIMEAKASAVTENDIAEQRRLMHERRELAKKRRLEEEAREEAARRERIRLKLEAMGPAPESRSARRAKEEVTPATHDHSPDAPAEQLSATDEQNSQHPPSILTKSETGPDTAANGVPLHAQPQTARSGEAVEGQSHAQETAHTQPWPNTSGQADWYRPRGMPASVKNVWASPSSDRSLGNGTFIADLGRASDPSQGPHISEKPGPGPIAPPHSSKGGLKPQAAAPSRLPPIGPPTQLSRQEANASKRNPMQNAWASRVRESDSVVEQELRAQGEEEAHKRESEGQKLADAQVPIKDSWRPTVLTEDGRRVIDGPRQTFQHSRGVAWGPSADTAQTQRPLPGTGQVGEAGQPQQISLIPGEASSGSILNAGAGAAPHQARGSRFFPSRGSRQEAAPGTESHRQSSPSPPPPDMDGHPAFDGDVARPHVSLPRPQPVVRLPPTPIGSAAASSTRAAPTFGWAAPAPFKGGEPGPSAAPNATREDHHGPEKSWQTRIDDLLGGRKGISPPKSLPVDSASRSSWEHHRQHNVATISLPLPMASAAKPVGGGFVTTSKDMAEECFEEQEMGSLPPIRLPNKVPEAAWQPYPAPKSLPKKLGPTTVSIEPLSFPNNLTGGGIVLRVSFPGMGETKNITIPFSRTRSNPRRQPRGGRQSSQAHRSSKQDQGGASGGRAGRGPGEAGGIAAGRTGPATPPIQQSRVRSDGEEHACKASAGPSH